MPADRLFQPLKVGTMDLKQRVAMAPCTRFRANNKHEILPMAAQYYAERGCVPGTLLITEATLISKQAGTFDNVPGIWSQAQIDAWKVVTNAVHEKGSYIYVQLWHLGRTADPKASEKEGITIKSSSAAPLGEGFGIPKEMTVEEIKETVEEYAQAARNAIEAGFDGVEIHAAHGFLIDQFLQDKCNQRTDSYGGSIENRSRFAVEVTQAVVDAVGAEKTGLRLNPYSDLHGMKMDDPIPQFTDIIKKLNVFNLAYLHLVEPRVADADNIEPAESIEPLLPHFNGTLVIAGGFKLHNTKEYVEKHKDTDIIIAFGRHFISTPDLVFRLQKGIEFNPYDRETFYFPGSEKGFNDYPFSNEWKAAQAP
ncbi:hypothetical protein COCCADRAFT_102377 [Bipolaris zeicola 26-R-13]|uniref:NADH:flavin oxidoreductase/NADH oxidase N-terminal domain-containing protein n=1 Tax=Cochliobolus carbonum (strain 26-R-13) TaxID=930089 RepID=W6Y6X9_COCC2|nr:uncharacterized protein COCCADRAFT_102377 [Bipolaris zeicola 26-R-13]EUC31024.1 hypothetical protein COCCADRAFT_102377 [Bipolaris zeicola 26-R-13]